jgi:hypothetical protein
MKTAVIAGSALASFCVEKFGNERIKEISTTDIQNRMNEFNKLASFNTLIA